MYLSSKNNYLNTMGIQRWRVRQNMENSENLEPEAHVAFETFSLFRSEVLWGTLLIESTGDSEEEIIKLLDAMLAAIDLKRCAVLESAQAGSLLRIVMGTALAQQVLGNSLSLDALREGNSERMRGESPIFVTFHPGMLLKDTSLKRKAWEDLKGLTLSSPRPLVGEGARRAGEGV